MLTQILSAKFEFSKNALYFKYTHSFRLIDQSRFQGPPPLALEFHSSFFRTAKLVDIFHHFSRHKLIFPRPLLFQLKTPQNLTLYSFFGGKRVRTFEERGINRNRKKRKIDEIAQLVRRQRDENTCAMENTMTSKGPCISHSLSLFPFLSRFFLPILSLPLSYRFSWDEKQHCDNRTLRQPENEEMVSELKRKREKIGRLCIPAAAAAATAGNLLAFPLSAFLLRTIYLTLILLLSFFHTISPTLTNSHTLSTISAVIFYSTHIQLLCLQQ